MNRYVQHVVFVLLVSGLIVGVAANAQAMLKESSGNSQSCKVWCPKVKYVCKPCRFHGKRPGSSCNSHDICCSFEIVGWYDCTPPGASCGNNGYHQGWQDADPSQNDQNRNNAGNNSQGNNPSRNNR